jgi:hypothetical protein
MSGGHEPALNFYASAYCGMGAGEMTRRPLDVSSHAPRVREEDYAMTLETSLETRGCERLLREGAMPIKRGQDGEPDREVLWGRNLHLWIEFKKAKTGRVRKDAEDLR